MQKCKCASISSASSSHFNSYLHNYLLTYHLSFVESFSRLFIAIFIYRPFQFLRFDDFFISLFDCKTNKSLKVRYSLFTTPLYPCFRGKLFFSLENSLIYTFSCNYFIGFVQFAMKRQLNTKKLITKKQSFEGKLITAHHVFKSSEINTRCHKVMLKNSYKNKSEKEAS